jgi:oligopeptide/dipeptide ABC transporter ATP-binding protein
MSPNPRAAPLLPASPLLEVEDLHTHFHLKKKTVRAVNGVSFAVRRGEIVGIAGESGAGKSVACLSILRLVPSPGRIERGRIRLGGEDLLSKSERQMRDLRGQTVSMVFEDPLNSLDPAFTVGELIGETLMLHKGLSRRDARDKARELLRLVGIPDPERRLANYPHELSGGMQQRVMIAVALSCDPALLIADNPTTALDVTIQIQILDLVKQLRERLAMGVLWITHDLGVVAKLCDRVVIMYAGEVMEQGPVYGVLKHPRHPYTRRLIDALPKLGRPEQRLMPIEGRPPDPAHLPEGCSFAPRCHKARPECEAGVVPLVESGDGRAVRCLFPEG